MAYKKGSEGYIAYPSLKEHERCCNEGCGFPRRKTGANKTAYVESPLCGHCFHAATEPPRHTYREGVTPIKKNYCENIDGRLGFICTATIAHRRQLDLDHINGDHDFNLSTNLQTLCKNCHAQKTWLQKNNKLTTPNIILKIMTKEQIQQQLIELYENQIMDLTMMSKIELGDDVIAEIRRLKGLLNEQPR